MPDSSPLTRDTRVAVVGGGPGGLMAAEVVARAGAAVTVFEQMPSVGRKLLLAGRGGLNLTHTEPLDDLLERYGPARKALAPAVEAFGPDDLRAWCAGLGQTPFVGSSGRVFPSGFRATPLLRAWLGRLDELGVERRVRHRWRGWSPEGILVEDAAGVGHDVSADVVVLALGGASWPRSGSDGAWVRVIEAVGVEVAALRPANVGFDVAWTEPFVDRFAGVPLKNVRLSVAGRSASARGDAMVTATGLEGGVVYAVGRDLRGAVEAEGRAVLTVDLHPDLRVEQLAERLGRRRPKDSTANFLRRAAGVAPVGVGLLREACGNRLPVDALDLAGLLKAVPIEVTGVGPIARAISTAGGVSLAEVDERFMLRRRPGTFVVGEMLDWEAPTGGYLLQATFSSAVAAARGAVDWLLQF